MGLWRINSLVGAPRLAWNQCKNSKSAPISRRAGENWRVRPRFKISLFGKLPSACRIQHYYWPSRTTTMVSQTKHLKIGGAVILVTAALVIGLSVGLTQKKNGEADTFRRAARLSIKPTSRRPKRPTRKPTTRKPTTKTPTRRPTTKVPTSAQQYTVLEKVKHDQTSFTWVLTSQRQALISC